MRTIELAYPHTLRIDELAETVCAIGFFDGIHKGHQEVIQTAVKKAEKQGLESAVITFHPHPSVILKKGTQHVKYITPMQEKQEVLRKLDVDRLYIITFNKELAQLSPQEFVNHFVIGLNVKHLIAGFDFTFGHKGKGTMQDISLYAKDNFTSTIIEKVSKSDDKVSSTRIRSCLKNGKIEEANELLGRPLSLKGIVVDGDKRGKTIGFPTANLKVDPDILFPMTGVYAVKVTYKQMSYDGVANIGVKPTFNEHQVEPTIEIHILDYNNDLYGEELKVEWHKFIRKEKKFSGVEELVNQIKQDEKKVRKFFLTNK